MENISQPTEIHDDMGSIPLIKFDNRPLDQNGRDYLILSIDGGGMRGVVPATILSLLEEKIGGKISKTVDCLSGSSTGGIIALGLSKPDKDGQAEYSAKDFLKMYIMHGKDIFTRSWWNIAAAGLKYSKYDPSPMEKIFKEKFGDTRLNEAVNDIMITSFDMLNNKDYIFTSFHGDQDNNTYLMSDIARATSAAPTFFPPKGLTDDKDETIHHNFIDGGFIANNPAEWSELISNSKLNLENRRIFILSIGTGQYKESQGKTAEETQNWGLFDWIYPLFNGLFSMMNSTVEEQLKLLAVNHDISYLRLEVELNKKYSLDNYNPQDLEKMEELSKDYFNKLLDESPIQEKLIIPLQNRLRESNTWEDIPV